MILRLGFTWLIIITFSFPSNAQNYAVNEIPKQLIDDAEGVIRDESIKVEVDEAGKVTKLVRSVITVLKPDGLHHSNIFLNYDSFQRIKSLNAKLYNKEGKIVERIRELDFHDFPMISNFSLYEDSRIKYYVPEPTDYPFTIEVNYILENDNLLNIGSWKPVKKNLSVQKSVFEIEYTDSYPLKFTSLLDSSLINYSYHNLDYTNHKWEALNISHNLLTDNYLLVAPETIIFDGTSYPNNSWKDFGEWFLELNASADELSVENQEVIKSIVADVDDDSLKIKKIYQYMQENTRYVNISLGTGGYQSIPSNRVHEVGYGDCKALTSYTKAMLKAVGIESNYALIRGGREDLEFYPDFASNQFNHVILAIPYKKDTIWLECTSQNVPFGFMGNFTDDRFALVIEDENSHLRKTPYYDESINKEIREIVIHANDSSSYNADYIVDFYGQSIETNGLSWIIEKDEKTKQEWIMNYLNLPFSEIERYEFTKYDSPRIRLNMTIRFKDLISQQNGMFIIKSMPLIKSIRSGQGIRANMETDFSYRIKEHIVFEMNNNGYYLNSGDSVNFAGSNGHLKIFLRPGESSFEVIKDFLYKKNDQTRAEDLNAFWRRLIGIEMKPIILNKKT